MNRLIILLIFLLFISCRHIKEVTFDKIESMEASSVSLQEIKLKVGAKITNPNNFKFTLKNMDVNIFVNGNDFGKTIIDEKEEVAANSSEIHYFFVETSPTAFFFQAIPLMNSISNHEEVSVKMKGRVKVSAFGISKKFPIDREEKIKIF